MTDGPRLRLVDGVTWDGDPLPGDRVATLLAVLALEPGGVSDARLVEEVWPDSLPVKPVKALQVLVSRIRSATDHDVVTRDAGGYRLGLAAGDVDALRLSHVVAGARRALVADPAAVVAALEDVTGLIPAGAARSDALTALRAEAAAQLTEAETLRARALVALGRAGEALPVLEPAVRRRPDDTALQLALLRAVAAVSGPAAALTRYDDYRVDVSERLGIDPDPALQRLHGELLAADTPVRSGLRFDGGQLLGREDDLVRLRTALAGGRLTTVLGPGGIGKTSIAQALARESTLPRVHVIELVGVASGDDIVAEVGAALGVRGSMTARRTLTPAQVADVRGRIAQALDEGPTLLVLDNCEHLLESVASLVAFLLVTTRDLRILTTSRAPLRIAAERVVPLSQLAEHDAAALFRRRARAVRPDAPLDPEQVAAVVSHLDGLPLAVELAAARVRTMSLVEIRRGLDRRFDLLRSRDRGAPERHRTLEAVIGWSWDLLAADEQRALATLSVFHDGFRATAATAVLGGRVGECLENLVDQSLLMVSEHDGATRFRFLETIREFAGLQLDAADGRPAAEAAQDAWAGAQADRHASLFVDPEQIARVASLRAEENNLTDVMRRALARADAPLVARLLAALGTLWTITGDHHRVFSVADATEELITGWDVPEELWSSAWEAAAILLIHLSWMTDRSLDGLLRATRSWGSPSTPWARAAQAMFGDLGDAADRADPARLAALSESEEPFNAGMMMLWASLTAENEGDPRAALDYAAKGLEHDHLTPYIEASLHSEMSSLLLVVGDHHGGAEHAEVAWPLLMQLHAVDDARQMRIATAILPLLEGDLETAEHILDEVESMGDGAQVGSRMALQAARAEVLLARGDAAAGLLAYDRAVQLVEETELAGEPFTPWLVMAASGALVARVHHAPDGPDARADDLAHLILVRTHLVGDGQAANPDLPMNGVLAVALGAWLLRGPERRRHEDGVRLLAIGHCWAYNRSLPSLQWPGLVALAEGALPGRLDAVLADYAGRPGVELLPEAGEILARVTSSR